MPEKEVIEGQLMGSGDAEESQVQGRAGERGHAPKRRKITVTFPQDYVFDPALYENSPIQPDSEINPDMLTMPLLFGDKVDEAEAESIDLYFADMKKFPLLTRELEQIVFTHLKQGHSVAELAMDEEFKKQFEHADPESVKFLLSSSPTIMDLIINTNIRFAAMVAHRFKGRMPLSDMITEGALGMKEAAERFDIKRGTKFTTYSAHWIARAIRRAIADESRTIRLPSNFATSYSRVERIVDRFFLEYERSPKYHELVALGEVNGVSKGEIEAMILSISKGSLKPITSLDVPVGGEGVKFGDVVRDESRDNDVEGLAIAGIEKELLSDAMEGLNERERYILMRRGEDATLSEIGQEFKRSRERIRQLEAKAFRKLRFAPGIQALKEKKEEEDL